MIQTNKLFAISPNPARHEIHLDTRNLQNKIGTIRIYNAYGDLIEVCDNQEFNSFRKTINISDYENGLYFWRRGDSTAFLPGQVSMLFHVPCPLSGIPKKQTFQLDLIKI